MAAADFDVLTLLPERVRTFFVFGVSQRLALYKMLESLVKGGVPLDVSLRRLMERKKAKNRPDVFLLKKWLARMDNGTPFHEAIVDEVPAQERILIAAGSLSDNIADGFHQAIVATRGAQEIRSVLIGGMTQPVVLMIAVFVMMIGFAKYMAPDFSRMVPEENWGGYSGALLKFSRHLDYGWPFLVLVIIAIVVIFFWSLPRWKGGLRRKADGFVPYSIYRSYSAASFLIALSALLRTSTPLDSAMRRIRQHSSPWLGEHITIMLQKMANGVEPGAAMDTGMLDGHTTDQLYIYSRSTDFSIAMKNIGELAIEQGISTIRAQSAVAKVVALACVGGMVLWMQLSLFDLEARISQPTPTASVR